MLPVVNEPAYRPCLVLAHRDGAFAKETARRFRRLGYDVYQAAGGGEARRLARMMSAELTVLDVELGDESGWLVCAKLRRERPEGRVVLLGDAGCARSVRMASFVGADALLRPEEAVAAAEQGTRSRAA